MSRPTSCPSRTSSASRTTSRRSRRRSTRSRSTASSPRAASRCSIENCAFCHEFGGARTGKVIPLAEVKTDRHRLDHWTEEAADRYNDYADGYDFDFKRFRKTDGYVAVAMDGLWMRAPYLHNGSVPSVEDLLKPVSERPKVFYRGYDVVHPTMLGFISLGTVGPARGLPV